MFSDSDSENRRSVRFAESVDPGETITLTKDVERDATVEETTVRIYRGAELALRIKPFVERDNRRFELIDYPQGKQYVDGDGDFWEFPVSEAVATEDVIGVEVENVATDYAYDFSTDMVLDRAGGTARAGGLLDAIRRLV